MLMLLNIKLFAITNIKLVIYAIILCGMFFHCFAQQAGIEVGESMSPPSLEHSTEVQVQVFIINVPDVDIPSETFKLDAYMILSWQDPRLSFSLDETDSDSVHVYLNNRITAQMDQMWWPNIEFTNQVGKREIQNSKLEITSEGIVSYLERFRATLSTDFDLRNFPFDMQQLVVNIEAFAFSRKEVELVSANGGIRFYNDKLELEEWSDLSIHSRDTVTFSSGSGKSYTAVKVLIDGKRKVGFYFWKILLPLFLIIMVSWSVFWMNEESVCNRLSISTIGLLTAVSFSFFINGILPKISYLTFIDMIIVTTYIIMAGTVLENMSVFILRKKGHSAMALKLDLMARWLFPLGYIVLISLSRLILFLS